MSNINITVIFDSSGGARKSGFGVLDLKTSHPNRIFGGTGDSTVRDGKGKKNVFDE